MAFIKARGVYKKYLQKGVKFRGLIPISTLKSQDKKSDHTMNDQNCFMYSNRTGINSFETVSHDEHACHDIDTGLNNIEPQIDSNNGTVYRESYVHSVNQNSNLHGNDELIGNCDDINHDNTVHDYSDILYIDALKNQENCKLIDCSDSNNDDLHYDDANEHGCDDTFYNDNTQFNNYSAEQHDVRKPFEETVELCDTETLHDLIHYLNQSTRCGITIGEFVLMALKISIVNHLSHQATMHILKSYSIICKDDRIPFNEYKLRKIVSIFLSSNTKYHFLCNQCSNHIFDSEIVPKQTIVCNVCLKNNDLDTLFASQFFITFDLSSTISWIMKKKDIIAQIKKSNFNENLEDYYRDMTDGARYKRIKSMVNLSEKELFATLTINSDGTPMSKSLNFQVWPIHAMINELNVECRSRNLILAGLWCGTSKPNMQIFLAPFVKNVNILYEQGIKIIQECGIEAILKILCSCCCVDSQARGPMQGMSQFNSYNGCAWCHINGEWYEGCVRYTMDNESSNDQLRTHDETLSIMKQIADGSRSISTQGVKHVSPFINLYGFDIIESFVPDSLHCIDLGVTRQFASYFFSSKKFTNGELNLSYIGSPENISKIDKIINNMKVPNSVQRSPRSIREMAHWKGSEWNNFLLVWSTPVLKQFLPQTYFKHWLKLVEGVYILSKAHVCKDEIIVADKLLFEFVYDCQKLYGKHSMTYNVHQLLHLARSVIQWGPLWCHNGYIFEAANGRIKSELHSIVGIPQQIVRLSKWIQVSEFIQMTSTISYEVNDFNRQIQKNKHSFQYNKVSETIKFVGKGMYEDGSKIIKYKRMIRDGKLYCTTGESEKNKKTDGSYVLLKSGTFGRILDFLLYNDSLKGRQSEGRSILVPCDEIVNQCVCITINTEKFISIVSCITLSS